MATAEVDYTDYTAYTVTARKDRPCEDYPRCYRGIRAGEEYARHVAFPGHDCNQGTRPYVMSICHECQSKYGRPMPPRRSYRKSPSISTQEETKEVPTPSSVDEGNPDL